MNESLFREEVLAERQSQWLGTVLLAPRLSYGVFATFKSEVAQLDGSIALQRDRVDLARKSQARQREIHARGLSSDQELQVSSEALLDQESKLRELTRSRIVAQGERLTLQGQLQDM